MKTNDIIELLRNEATELEEWGGAKIVSALVYKRKIISLGWNHNKTSPFQKMYGKNNKSIYYHSETHAIRKASRVLSLDKIAKSTLFVCRIKKNGQLGLSKPCVGCRKAIEAFGIREVIYSTENNFEKMTFEY